MTSNWETIKRELDKCDHVKTCPASTTIVREDGEKLLALIWIKKANNNFP